MSCVSEFGTVVRLDVEEMFFDSLLDETKTWIDYTRGTGLGYDITVLSDEPSYSWASGRNSNCACVDVSGDLC